MPVLTSHTYVWTRTAAVSQSVILKACVDQGAVCVVCPMYGGARSGGNRDPAAGEKALETRALWRGNSAEAVRGRPARKKFRD